MPPVEAGTAGQPRRTGEPPSPAPADAESPGVDGGRHVLGAATVRRIGGWRFPTYELAQDGEVLALLGRLGWFRVYFGPGQRIELPDGSRWRIRSVAVGAALCPIVVDSSRDKVAIAGIGHGTYRINTKDYACVFFPADRRRFGRRRWMLRHFEEELAVVTRSPLSIEAMRPVPLGVVLLCFVLARYGIPGEAVPRLPSFSWRKP